MLPGYQHDHIVRPTWHLAWQVIQHHRDDPQPHFRCMITLGLQLGSASNCSDQLQVAAQSLWARSLQVYSHGMPDALS